MHKPNCIVLILFMFLSLATASHAQDNWFNQGDKGFFALGKVSSLGIGGEVGYKFNDFLAARINMQGVSFYLGEYKYSGINVNEYVDLLSGGLVLDVYPFGRRDNAFLKNLFLSGGLYLNGNEGRGTAQINPLGFYRFGSQSFFGFVIGDPSVRVRYNVVNPYLGLGWQGWFDQESNWQLQVNLGLLFQGGADVTIRGYNPLNPVVVQEAVHLRNQIKDVADGYQVYPVVSLGVGYKF